MVKMVKWFKNLNVVAKSFLFILLAFVATCFFISKIYSPITNEQWITIISTFFAGTLGGLIALGGIWWQLNYEKEETVHKVNRYIHYIVLRKNINKIIENNHDFEDEFINIFKELKYRNSKISSTYGTQQIKYFFEFDEDYIHNNINTILDNSNGEEILNLQSEIKLFNLDYHHLIVDRSFEKEEILDYCRELDNLTNLKKHLQLVLKINEPSEIDAKDITLLKKALNNYENSDFKLFYENLNQLLKSNITHLNKEVVKKGMLVLEKEKIDDLNTKLKLHKICIFLELSSRYSDKFFNESSLNLFKAHINNSQVEEKNNFISQLEAFSPLEELSKEKRLKQLSEFYNLCFNFILIELQNLQFKSKNLDNLRINFMTHLAKDITFCKRIFSLYESFNKVKNILD